MGATILIGDCRLRMKELADNSVDSVVCDPPYHLTSIVKRFGATNAAPAKVGKTGAYARHSTGFMGQKWDGGDVAFQPETWAEVLRVMKPGGHLVAFSGTRTYHRMVVAIEDAGFEVRDQLAWVYGSGFPKSHDVSKGIDKAAGNLGAQSVGFNVAGKSSGLGVIQRPELRSDHPDYEPYEAKDASAQQWQGWGTALKPSWEPILFGSKPLTVGQHFAVLIHELTTRFAEVAIWLNLNAPDAARRINAIQARCAEAAHTVLDSAKIRSLESIGIAPSVAQGSTFSAPASSALTRTRGCSALSHVRPSGSEELAPEPTIHPGAVADTLTRLMDMSTSVITGDISESIVWSWLATSDAILSETSRFTIETASRLTTALRILSCSLRENTSSDTGSFTPNWEPICLARKPLVGTVAANVMAHGTGALNIDGCRVGTTEADARDVGRQINRNVRSSEDGWGMNRDGAEVVQSVVPPEGRWPANLCHDGSDEVLAGFPETGPSSQAREHKSLQRQDNAVYGKGLGTISPDNTYADNGGSAARFFYTAKATGAERGEGNTHPTVKPISLMRWLCRLVTPPGGTVLDPFMGSGSTLIAADAEQFHAIGCELSPEYAAIAERRIRDAAGMFADVKVAA